MLYDSLGLPACILDGNGHNSTKWQCQNLLWDSQSDLVTILDKYLLPGCNFINRAGAQKHLQKTNTKEWQWQLNQNRPQLSNKHEMMFSILRASAALIWSCGFSKLCHIHRLTQGQADSLIPSIIYIHASSLQNICFSCLFWRQEARRNYLCLAKIVCLSGDAVNRSIA